MKRNTALKIFGGIAAVLASVFIIAWFLWVPFAREPGYVFVAAWGESGSRPGQFNDPTGIAVTDTEVFVSDARNARIQVFDFDGHFRRQFDTDAVGHGPRGRPMNLTIAEDEVYVADYWNDQVRVFGFNGTLRRVIGDAGSGPGEFKAPGGVAVATNGDLFVADFYNQRVQHLHADGSFVKQWGQTGQVGIWSGEFNYPTAVAISRDGTLYVADGYNDRIQVFSSAGMFLHKWGGPLALNIFGPFNGWFATVTSVTVDDHSNVFVADFYNNRIQKFTSEGKFLTAFGELGDRPGQFRHAIAVAVASDGTVFVADYGNNRIQKWRSKE